MPSPATPLFRSSWKPPPSFEEYRVISPLSRGGMGEVYLGHDTLLERPVAIKFIGAHKPDEKTREQFLTEARAAARLQHPNVVSIYRVGEFDGRPYIISEFVRGKTLDVLATPITWQRALELGLGLASGLAAAHRSGVLHRDIKPSNVIIGAGGEAKLLDFGLAEFIDSGTLPPPATLVPPSGVEPRLIGTPHYMAPELWRGEPSTRQSDIYAMGALLFELCAGSPPHYDPLTSVEDLRGRIISRDAPPLTDLVPDIAPRFAAVVAQCLKRAPSERYPSGEALREALEALRPSDQKSSVPEGNPYRGLFAFEAEHRALFFGRQNEIGTVIERLRTEPFIVVAADSGIGKSSLCRAGILPLIGEGALGGGRGWQALPLYPGRAPIAALCAALALLFDVPEAELDARLRCEPTELGRALHRKLGDRRGVVLFIDQLEELLTLAPPDEAGLFGQALGQLAQRLPGVRLLMTARSDFLARIATLPGFGDELSRGLYFLRPLSPDKIRQAIVGPARKKSVRFESEALVEALVQETGKTDGGLPLLQFALTELWDARKGDLITEESLQAIGGVAGALARHADQVLFILPADQRIAARRILMALVTLEGTRARRTDEELGQNDAAQQALLALTRGRMIVAHATSDGTAYEVAHEALLKGWGTLRHWLEEFAESRAVKQRLETAAAEWIRLGRAKAGLWSGPQLGELGILDPGDFTPKERAFIAASHAAQRRGRRLRNASIIGLPLLVGLVYGGMQYKHSRERSHKVAEHLQHGRVLLDAARRTEAQFAALQQSAFAAFDSQKKDEGEKQWARALVAAAETEEQFGHASQALEAALTIDPNRDDARELLAQALLESALSAERNQHFAKRDDLVQRMALYDLTGQRQRHWQAPAQLFIDTEPPGAQVELQRYEKSERRPQLGRRIDLGHAPQHGVALQAGAYLLLFNLPERAPVHYPLLLQRGEKLHISVELPPPAAIPRDFIYIPKGRFRFGTSSDESVRQGFLSTVPIHEVTTAAYLIARNEITYGDWIKFLNALPQGERAKRTPAVPKGGIGGGVELKQLPDKSWQLTLQPTTQAYTVREGEPIVYAARKLRHVQDWRRLPLGGVGPDDVRAYAAWLERSGQVAGARLCSEREWERAARGADDREFPHGNELDPAEANYDETYGKEAASAGPDAVGSYPASQSPFGLLDMAGNVFEWTESSLSANEHVVRGGGYFQGAIAARSTNRSAVDAGFRDPAIGARICASLPTR